MRATDAQVPSGARLAACFAGALLLAALGCEAALYPLARASGSPPESELAACRSRLREMQRALPGARLIVHPPSVLTSDAGRWDSTAAGWTAEALKAKGFRDVTAEQGLPEVPFDAPGHNQLRHTWARAHAYAAWARRAQLGAGWHVFCDFVVTGGQLAGVGVYVTDAEGNLALVRLLNSHHEEWKVGTSGLAESASAMVVDVLLQGLTIPPERLYPPYGVG